MPEPSRPSLRVIAALVLVAGCVAFWHVTAARAVAPDRDVALYAVVGHELRHGAALYVDVWDHKPPGIYTAYAMTEALVGSPIDAIVWLRAIASLVLVTGVFAAARRVTGRDGAALVAAVAWAGMSADARLEAVHANAEALTAGLAAWAIAQWIAGRGWVAGVLAFLAIVVKPVALPAFALVVVATLVFEPDRRAVVTRGVWALVAMLAGTLLVVGWLAATGALSAAWDAVVTYNRSYAGPGAWDVVASVSIDAPWAPAIWAAALAGAVLAPLGRMRRAALVAWLVGTAIGVAGPGHFFPHYDQLWLPALAVAVGALATIEMRWGRVLVAFVLVGLAGIRVADHGVATVRDAEQFRAARAAGRALDAGLPAGAQLFVWSDEPHVYLYARRRPPAPLLFAMHTFRGSACDRLVDETVARLAAAPPACVALEEGVTVLALRGLGSGAPAARLVEWIHRHYEADSTVGDVPGYTFLRRRVAPLRG